MFELAEAFVSRAVSRSRGQLYLLSGQPGGGLFCLELDDTVRQRFVIFSFSGGYAERRAYVPDAVSPWHDKFA